MAHFHANMGSVPLGTRDPVDRYETPSSVTEGLLRRIWLPPCVREPACGTGRIADILRFAGYQVLASDLLEHGHDFLKENGHYPRHCAVVTNPPYRDGLAEAFVRKALELYDGPVWMLLRSGFAWGQGRTRGLHSERPPQQIIVVPCRIMFYNADGTRIKGQAYDHAWFGWNVEPRPLQWIDPEELYDATTRS